MKAEISRRKKRRWTGYATLLATCIGIDLIPLGAISVDALKNFEHFGQNIGLTAFLPTTHLFILWIQPSSSLLTRESFIRFIDKRASGFVKNWDSNPIYTKYPKLCKICGVLFLLILNCICGYFFPKLVYLLATAVPFGLYVLDGLLNHSQRFRSTDLLEWSLYHGVLVTSIVLYVAGLLNYRSPTVSFPSLYLVVVSPRLANGGRRIWAD